MKMHILSGAAPGQYNVVVHGPVPGGTNQAGFTWAECFVSSGLNHTVMTVGPGPGQTTQAEVDSIAAGTTMEGMFIWQDDPTWTNAQRVADLDLRAQQMLAEMQANYQQRFKLFGMTRN